MSRQQDQCFGLPNSGRIVTAIIGILIIVWGLSMLLGWEINTMALIIIIFGGLMVAGAVYRLMRKR